MYYIGVMLRNKKMVGDVTTYLTGHLLNMQAFKVKDDSEFVYLRTNYDLMHSLLCSEYPNI